MKVLFFDCKNGISGDMMLKALMDLGHCKKEVEAAMKAALERIMKSEAEGDAEKTIPGSHGEGCGEHNSHGRSYREVKDIVDGSGFSQIAKDYAKSIYKCIAQAEAQVHGMTLETVHFHEVGRDQAINNALGIGAALETIAPDMILVSPIYDGKGFVDCSHGRIPVPVPAVKALMKRSGFDFRTAQVNTEMVTPSGLAALMGIGAKPMNSRRIGAKPMDSRRMGEEDSDTHEADPRSLGQIIKQTEATGSRSIGRGGLKAYIIETL